MNNTQEKSQTTNKKFYAATSAQKLGFMGDESAEIVSELNTVLSSYQIFFHKLQNFHWNVVGGDFFDIHELTQEMYNTALEDIDDLAERVRVFGRTPFYKLTDYQKHSLVKESQFNLNAEEMAKQITFDLQKLIETLIGLHEASSIHGDVGGTHMASKLIKKMETNHWKLSAWCQRRDQEKK